MKPIMLTEHGDTLREYPKDKWQYREAGIGPNEDNPEDELEELSCCIGLHDICNCWVDHHHISKTHDALTCRCCGLRYVYPKSVKTFGQLREHAAKALIDEKVDRFLAAI